MTKNITLICALLLAACGETAPAAPAAAPTPPPAETAPAVAAPVAEAPAAEPAHLPPADPAAVERATATGTLARAILAAPANADTLITGAGLTRETFEAQVYEAAGHPALATAYRTALEAP